MLNKMKIYRKENHMTQQQLAKEVGVSSRTIIALEKGEYNPSLMLAYKIAKIFNTSVDEIFCLEDNLKGELKNE